MPSKKKKYNARFPPARIKKIMQTDDEVGKVAAAVPVIISRALELFVEALVRRGSEITKSRNAKTLTTSHLKACILSEESFEFLTDLVTAIPDVQAEEELGTPQPTDNMQGHFPLLNRSTPKQSSRGRRSRNGENAGPSHSTTEDTDSYDEDELEDEEEEGESSENTGSDTHHGQRELYIPHAEVHSMGAALLGPNNSADDEDDEDYDA